MTRMKGVLFAIWLATGVAAGCDDSGGSAADGAPDGGADAAGDSDTDADTDTETDPDGGSSAARVVVAGATWGESSGKLFLVDLGTLDAIEIDVPVGTDAVVRCQGQDVFVLDRYFPTPPDETPNRLLHLSGQGLELQGQADLGLYVNAHGAVRRGDDIFVTAYGAGLLIRVDAGAQPYVVADTLDLSTYAAGHDGDGNPDPNAMAIVNDTIYIGLAHEASWMATDYATIAVYDVANDILVDMDAVTDGVQGIEIQGSRIFDNTLEIRDGKMFFNASGNSDWAGGYYDGAIRRVDISTATDEGTVVEEQLVGGNILSWTFAGDQWIWAVVNSPDEGDGAVDRLVAIDIGQDPPAVSIVATSAADTLWQVASSPSGDEVLLADRTAGEECLRRFTAAQQTELEAIALDPPASSFCFVGQ